MSRHDSELSLHQMDEPCQRSNNTLREQEVQDAKASCG